MLDSLTQAPPPPARHWSAAFTQPGTLALFAGGVASMTALLVVLLLAVHDFRSSLEASRNHAALLARVLEDQATRSIESAQLAMGALAESAALRELSGEQDAIKPLLEQALISLPYLRAMAVLDDSGRVLSSTSAADKGLVVQVGRLGPVMEPGRNAMGKLVLGRGLASVSQSGAEPVVPAGVAFLPLLYGYATDTNERRTLVGLINPDAFSNFQHLTLDAETFHSVIASYDGTVLATSGAAASMVGKQVAHIPVFQKYLPRIEHGQYHGEGVMGPNQILAFRASSTKPLVVILEEAYDVALWRWLYAAQGLLGIGLALVLLVVGLAFALWRGVRTRQAARQAVDDAQARIAQSERDLAVLMRSVQELIFRTDAQGVITFVNARWAALSGQPTAQILGKRLEDFVDVSCRRDVQDLLDSHSGSGARNCQVKVSVQGERPLLFQMAVVPLQSDGRIVGFAGSAVDVTARWEAQQRLQAQIVFQELLLETNPLPILVADTQGHVMQVNRAWEDYKGRTRQAVTGLQLWSFLPPDEARVHQESDAQILANGGSTFFETRIMHGDGTRHDTRVIKAAIKGNQGQPSGVLTILMDVSEFRQAERTTQEARQAAEEASRAKSEFVANMSHELRTPLQSILGFAELGMLRGKEQPKLCGMFEDIHSAGQRMLQLVNDLLEVSRLESTVGTFHMERIDLRGVIRPVVRELEPLLDRQHQNLQVDFSDLPLVAKADPLRFQQVVRNVLANAIKFSPPGSTITLVGDTDAQGQVHLTVHDQGPGIPEAELETIFEAFVQSSHTKDGSGGTGLGLAICRKIVHAMGGRIYAENTPPVGAAFHIVLPARGFAETQPAPL
jgi:PAS domain S-box-containing protein